MQCPDVRRLSGDVIRHRGPPEVPCQNTWEVTRAQSGASGILVDYTGGTIGASFGTGTPEELAAQFLAQIEPVLPGISAQWNERATVDFWLGNPFTLGSYSYWKVGQYTQFAVSKAVRKGTHSSAASTRRSTSRAT
jgi:monoamine oxidase